LPCGANSGLGATFVRSQSELLQEAPPGLGKICRRPVSGRTVVVDVPIGGWAPPSFAHRVSSYRRHLRVWEKYVGDRSPGARWWLVGPLGGWAPPSFAHRVSSYGVPLRVWEKYVGARSPGERWWLMCQ